MLSKVASISGSISGGKVACLEGHTRNWKRLERFKMSRRPVRRTLNFINDMDPTCLLCQKMLDQNVDKSGTV